MSSEQRSVRKPNAFCDAIHITQLTSRVTLYKRLDVAASLQISGTCREHMAAAPVLHHLLKHHSPSMLNLQTGQHDAQQICRHILHEDLLLHPHTLSWQSA